MVFFFGIKASRPMLWDIKIKAPAASFLTLFYSVCLSACLVASWLSVRGWYKLIENSSASSLSSSNYMGPLSKVFHPRLVMKWAEDFWYLPLCWMTNATHTSSILSSGKELPCHQCTESIMNSYLSKYIIHLCLGKTLWLLLPANIQNRHNKSTTKRFLVPRFCPNEKIIHFLWHNNKLLPQIGFTFSPLFLVTRSITRFCHWQFGHFQLLDRIKSTISLMPSYFQGCRVRTK